MSEPSGLATLDPRQAAAADPASHVWLGASAGTGKTQVLSARVLRLMLDGVSPEAILCITFTKAGAAEMAHRIHERLAAWVRMEDGDLRLDLRALGLDWDRPGLMARARAVRYRDRQPRRRDPRPDDPQLLPDPARQLSARGEAAAGLPSDRGG